MTSRSTVSEIWGSVPTPSSLQRVRRCRDVGHISHPSACGLPLREHSLQCLHIGIEVICYIKSKHSDGTLVDAEEKSLKIPFVRGMLVHLSNPIKLRWLPCDGLLSFPGFFCAFLVSPFAARATNPLSPMFDLIVQRGRLRCTPVSPWMLPRARPA